MRDPGGRIVTVLFADVPPERSRIIRDVVGDGRVRTVAGGCSAAFSDTAGALRAAAELQRAAARHELERSASQPRLRVGVHVGNSRPHALTVARSLCSCAEPGQIVVSTLVCGLVGTRGGFSFTYLGPRELPGLTRPIATLVLDWTAGPAAWRSTSGSAAREASDLGDGVWG